MVLAPAIYLAQRGAIGGTIPITASGWLDSIVDRALTPLTGDTTMDPQATLTAAVLAFKARDFEEAREYVANYRAWRAKGGFEPFGGDECAAHLEKHLRKPQTATAE